MAMGRVWLGGFLLLVCAAPAAGQSVGVLGDPGAVRARLGNVGVTFELNDSETLLGDLAGGVEQGATGEGVATAVVEVETGKAFRLQGGTFHVSALQIHGRSLSPYYLDDLQSANGNESEDATRLWELWYDQVFDGGRADVKVGQQSIDNEFIIANDSGLFVNTMAGWPLVTSDDLYGGGPAYPLASLGVRGLVKVTGAQTVLAGVLDDKRGGGAFSADAQALDATGARFSLRTGALVTAEWQLAVGTTLSGSYKAGFWYDTGAFPDERYGADGLSLARAESDGVPLLRHGNYSGYLVADQTVWQSAADTARQVSVFGRVMGAPGAQNLVDFRFIPVDAASDSLGIPKRSAL